MGTWGTGIFSNDISRDVRDHYRELLEDGVDDAEATRRTLDKFRSYFDDPEEGVNCIVALAITQSKIGRLDANLCARALTAIDSGSDLKMWEQENPKLLPKRCEALNKARAQLTGPQPARKRLRPPPRPTCGLVAGDVLALTTPTGMALLRVVRVKSHRRGETPYIEQLKFDGFELPSAEALEKLEAADKFMLGLIHASSGDCRFTAFTSYDKIDWQAAGFTKAAILACRSGDEQAAYPGYGIAWSALAERLRRRGAV
jgi:hypothetical protein